MPSTQNRPHKSNNSQTSLRKRRRNTDPMGLYDQLPTELRHWLMNACLPWSPQSCLKIWRKARSSGANSTEVLARLSQIETAMLARDKYSPQTKRI